MLNATFRPLDKWPGERCKTRRHSQFRANYNNTLDKLEEELGKLRAKDIIIRVDELSFDEIRNDGWPKSSFAPRHTAGVIVSCESPKGALSFPCDRYLDWQDNLRAIALSLEALRAVDRYGVTRGNEQYRGWTQIAAPAGKMSKEEAARFVAELSGQQHVRQDDLEGVLRTLKIQYHPDRAEQLDDNAKRHRHELFVRIGQAEAVLCGGGK